MHRERITETENRYNEIQEQRNELIKQANDLLTEMYRLEGEHRALLALQEVDPVGDASTLIVEPEKEEE